MFFRAGKTHAVSFLNGFKNPCLSRNLDEGGMNALMVNYVLIKKSAPCLATVKGSESFWLKCCLNACFENQKVLRKRRSTWIVVFQSLCGMPQGGLT